MLDWNREDAIFSLASARPPDIGSEAFFISLLCGSLLFVIYPVPLMFEDDIRSDSNGNVHLLR
jgi:hypothetical protein